MCPVASGERSCPGCPAGAWGVRGRRRRPFSRLLLPAVSLPGAGKRRSCFAARGGGKEREGRPLEEEEEQQPQRRLDPSLPEGQRGGGASRPGGRGKAALGPAPARAPRLFSGTKFRRGALRVRRLPEEGGRRCPPSARASPGAAVAERRGRGAAAVRDLGGRSLAGGGLPRPWSRSTRSCSPSAARAWRRP